MRIAIVLCVLAMLSACAVSGPYGYAPAQDPNLWLYIGNQMSNQAQVQQNQVWDNYYRSQQRINQINDQYQQQLNQTFENQRIIDAIKGR